MHPEFFDSKRVLEVGSRNINGTVRDFFGNCIYIGIDCVQGKDVDLVCLAHEYDSEELFDTVISCEAFEHDPHIDETIANCMRLLKPGGLFVATMAGRTRQEHGTARSHTDSCQEEFGPDPNYYKNVEADDLRWALKPYLDPLEIEEARGAADLYAWGIRNEVSLSYQHSPSEGTGSSAGDDDSSHLWKGVPPTGAAERVPVLVPKPDVPKRRSSRSK
jgi:SAM-dependent methyltransferase